MDEKQLQSVTQSTIAAWLRLSLLSAQSKGVRRKVSWDGVHSVTWHMMVICIWCALFVTSQFDVISMFPNQRFGEVYWHSAHVLLHPLSLFEHPLSLFYVSLHWI